MKRIIKTLIRSDFFKTYYRFKVDERSVFIRVPMSKYNEFKSLFGSTFKLRYRGPRVHRIAQGRSRDACQSTCLKQDATHFTAYLK